MISITAPNIVRIGANASLELADVLMILGCERPLLVVDPHFKNSGFIKRLEQTLSEAHKSASFFYDVVPDPTSISVESGVVQAHAHTADCIVAIGGGSAIDTAKAIGLLAKHQLTLRSISAPYRVIEKGLPVIAIPTTAGTGSEATRFCLVTDSATHDKLVCIGEGFMPTAALIDHTLTFTVPASVTAHTGIDAFTHALEAYVGRKANAISVLQAEKALKLIGKALPALMSDLSNERAREDMMLGSYLAGNSFSNSGLALAHGMSAPLGGAFNIPHGLAIGLLIPETTRFSIARTPNPYARVAHLLELSKSNDDAEAAKSFMTWLDELNKALALPTLSKLGIDQKSYFNAIEKMAEETPRSGAAANNPAIPSFEETVELFKKIWR
ncbi:alcohol dehydrogenase [Pusillimonas sp. T2]|uniref:iron-containing alcohol dehydrogenase n=1 Tax=Pusillimonas sp. T2 TaxID=1548123 RepID=UPI000B9CF3FF|nr:iron-containing alcohol dehydrogenase [Pusillimonas sp. T2]OXR49477.1 alcohol dehydrogenase [Pusillimonas sp. T2]